MRINVKVGPYFKQIQILPFANVKGLWKLSRAVNILFIAKSEKTRLYTFYDIFLCIGYAL